MSDKNHNIAIKAKEIAEKIGNGIYKEDYYSDSLIGTKYIFDNLRIDYYDYWDTLYTPKGEEHTCTVTIHINDTLLFSYNFCTNKSYCRDGNWVRSIDEIYKTIPIILQKRENEKRNTKEKIDKLRSLEDSFKYYAECFQSKSKHNVLEYIKSELEKNGISCLPSKRSSLISTSFSEYPQYTYYIIHEVYYSDEKVAEFYNSQFDVFPNIDCYIDDFKPGYWTNAFKDIIKHARCFDEKSTDNSIMNEIDEIVKKINLSLDKLK